MGYMILLAVVAITVYDFFRVLNRLYRFFRNGSSKPVTVSPRAFWDTVIRGKPAKYDDDTNNVTTGEYTPFHQDYEHEHLDLSDESGRQYTTSSPEHMEFQDIEIDEKPHQHHTDGRPKSVRMSYMRHSYHSEHSTSSTLRDEPISPNFSNEHLNHHSQRRSMYGVHDRHHHFEGEDEEEEFVPDIEDEPKDEGSTRLERFLTMAVYLGEWALVAFAYVEVVTGTVTYSGICRATYANGCLAHLIS